MTIHQLLQLQLLSLLLLQLLQHSHCATLEAEVCSRPAHLPIRLGSTAPQVQVPVLAALRKTGADGFGCSHVVEDAWPGIKALEWAFQLLSKSTGTEAGVAINDSYVPGVTFGITVYDTCGVKQSAAAAVGTAFPELMATQASCNASSGIVPGVISGSNSDTSAFIAPLLQPFNIPIVSYMAAAAELSNRTVYPNFYRTVPSNEQQAQALGAVLAQYKWTRIGILRTSDAYGSSSYNALVREANRRGICVAASASVPASPSTNSTQVSAALQLLRDSGVAAVVTLTSALDYSLVFNDALSSSFQWLMSDSFSSPQPLNSLRNARGLTALSPGFRFNEQFEQFFIDELARVTSSSDTAADVSFKQWYMQVNNCSLAGHSNSATPGAATCPTFSRSAAVAQYRQLASVEPAIDAAFTFAAAVRRLWTSKCAGVRGDCAALRAATFAEFAAAIAATDLTFTSTERIARYATSGSEPDRKVKRLQLTASGTPLEVNHFVLNLRQNSTGYSYSRVGTYLQGAFSEWRPGSVQMFNAARDTVIPVPALGCPGTGACAGCASVGADLKFAFIPGDLLLLGVFSVHESGPDGTGCGRISVSGGSELDAFLWAVSQSNQLANSSGWYAGSQLLGAVAIDDCGSGQTGRQLAESLLTGARRLPGVDASRIVGVVAGGGPSPSGDAVASLLASLGRSQVSYLPSTLASNFRQFSTVDSSAAEASAAASALLATGANAVQLLHSRDPRSREAARLFVAEALARRICVSATLAIGASNHSSVATALMSRPTAAAVAAFVSAADAAKVLEQVGSNSSLQFVGASLWAAGAAPLTQATSTGSLSLGQAAASSSSSYSAWAASMRTLASATSRNPWHEEWLRQLLGCSPSPAACSSLPAAAASQHNVTAGGGYRQSEFAEAAVGAVAAYAQSVAAAVRAACGASSLSSVCNAFLLASSQQSDVAAQLSNLTFADFDAGSFSFVSRSNPVGFSVLNVQNTTTGRQYITLGRSRPTFSFNAAAAQLQRSGASCSSLRQCPECAAALANSGVMYIAGDLLVGVLANVRAAGAAGACGDVTVAGGFVLTEAVRWTVQQLNNNTWPSAALRGSVQLGAVILDACNSASVATGLVTGASVGSLQLTDPVSGAGIDATKIRAWISFGDAAALSLAPALTGVSGPPLISASAGSDLLTSLRVFRTVPADSDQVGAVLAVLRRFNWRCAHVVSSTSAYGTALAAEFRRRAIADGVCVPSCSQFAVNGDAAAIAASIASSNNSKIVVVFTQNANELLQLAASSSDLQLIGSSYWGEAARSRQLESQLGSSANNTWIVQANSPVVSQVSTHLDSLNVGTGAGNPWLQAYYESLFNCSIAGSAAAAAACNLSAAISSAAAYTQPLHTMTTIDAVLTVSKAFSDVLSAVCGANYTSVCSSFWTDSRLNSLTSQKLDELNITSLRGAALSYRPARDGNAGWSLLNRINSDYVTVAEWQSGSSLRELPALAARVSLYSSVPAACSPCVNCPATANRSESFVFLPGQLLIGGLFDVHQAGTEPLTCGRLNNANGFLLTEVFKFALESLKTSPIFADKLNGVTIGGVAMDTCSSSLRSDALVANLHSRATVLRDAALNRVDPELIMAYVAASSSDQATSLSRVTDAIGAPVISYAATSQSLSNKQQYPYFSRTVPSQAKLAIAVAQLLKRLGLTNAQIVASPDSYGVSAAESLRAAVGSEGVCVSAAVSSDRVGFSSSEADSLAEKLLQRPNATAIVVLLPHDDLVNLLAAVSRNNMTAGRFLFIGGPSWGRQLSVLSNITNNMYPNALTFDFETGDLNDFERNYLLSKTPVSYSANPWFNESYELLYNCSLTGSSPYYSSSCASNTRPLTDSASYSQDSLALYVVNAVYATALGIHNALAAVCGAAYNGVCADFYTTGEKRQRVLSGVRSAAPFIDATRQNFSIDSFGDSNRGYHIYQLTAAPAPTYSSIGAYNDTAQLKLRADFSLPWVSNCTDATAQCSEYCPRVLQNRSVYMQSNTSTMDLNLIQFVSIHNSGSGGLNCGNMEAVGGFNELLAFHYALQVANSDSDVALAGLRFGGLSIDACESRSRAASFAFAFASGNGLCEFANFSELVPPLSAVAYLGHGADVTNGVAATVVNDTVITPDASSILLADVAAFPRVLRAVPPDSLQIEALLDIAHASNWTVVTLLHESTAEGLAAKAAFEAAVASRNSSLGRICVKFVPASSGGMSAMQARAAVLAASQISYSSALILFLPEAGIRAVLSGIDQLGLRGRFVLLGFDSWADRMSVVQGLEEVARGAVTLRRPYFRIPAFEAWASEIRLDAAGRKGIPSDWIEEFWQHSQSCRLLGSSVTQPQYSSVCSSAGTLPATALQQSSATLYTIISTLVIAKGVADFKKSECGSQRVDACLYSLPPAERRQKLHSRIRNAQWQVLRDLAGNNSFLFKFTEAGYGDVGYDVLNFVRSATGFQYSKVGSWFEKLQMDPGMRLITYAADGSTLTSLPASACPAGSSCGCPGLADTPLSLLQQQTVWQRATQIWGVVVLALAGIGCLATIGTFCFFAAAYPARISGTRGTSFLGYGCLMGILLLFALCPAFVAHATPASCGIRRFALPVAHSVAAACLLVRAVVHCGLQREGVTFSGVSHPASLLAMGVSISLAAAMVAAEWLILQPPNSQLIGHSGFAWPRCSPTEFYDQALALCCLPAGALWLAAAAFGLASWQSLDSKQIVLAAVLCLAGLAASLLIGSLADFTWRDPAFAVGALFCATVLLLCLFVHKIVQLYRLRREEPQAEDEDFKSQGKPASSLDSY